MDTKDPRFQSAYNDLVGAFLRFVNLVNDGKLGKDHVDLICASLSSLIGMMREDNGDTIRRETETPSVMQEPVGHGISDVISHRFEDTQHDETKRGQERPVEQEPIAAAQTTVQSGELQKRFAERPTYSENDEVYKFLGASLRREKDFDPETNPDAPDMTAFLFELELGSDTGSFYLNSKAVLNPERMSMFSAEYVKVNPGTTPQNVTVSKPGELRKCKRGWEVVSPLVLTSK